MKEKIIYFDNAATGLLKPDCVYDAVLDALKRSGNSGRGASYSTIYANRILFNSRLKISDMVYKSKPNRVALTSGATESLNILISNIKPNDHIITTVTEHNSVLRPLYRKQMQGTELSFLDFDNLKNIEKALLENIKINTKMVIVNHASNVTGNVLDIAKIGKICAENNILFAVDASQSIAHIDIDLIRDNIDILCFSAHKGLMAPQGTGAIVLKEGVELESYNVGGSGFDSFNHTHPINMPEKLEAGTINSHGFAGLNAALKYLSDYSITKANNESKLILDTFLDGVSAIGKYTIYRPDYSDKFVPVVSINLSNISSAMLADKLEQKAFIATRAGAHCAPLMHNALKTTKQGTLRFSFSHLNTLDEVYEALNCLEDIANER